MSYFDLYRGATLPSSTINSLSKVNAQASYSGAIDRRKKLLEEGLQKGTISANQLGAADATLLGLGGGRRVLGSLNVDKSGGGGVGGFISNLGEDVLNFGKELVPGLVHTVYSAGYDLADAAKGNQHPSMFVHDVLKPMGKQYSQTYGHGFGNFLKQFYAHPLGPILDIASVASLGAGGAARAGSLVAKTAPLDSAVGRIGARLARIPATDGRAPVNLGNEVEFQRRYSRRPLVKGSQIIGDRITDSLPHQLGLQKVREMRALRSYTREAYQYKQHLVAQTLKENLLPLEQPFKQLSPHESTALHLVLRGVNTPRRLTAFENLMRNSLEGKNPEGHNISDFADADRRHTEHLANLPDEVRELALHPNEAMINAAEAWAKSVASGHELLDITPEVHQAAVERPANILDDFAATGRVETEKLEPRPLGPDEPPTVMPNEDLDAAQKLIQDNPDMDLQVRFNPNWEADEAAHIAARDATIKEYGPTLTEDNWHDAIAAYIRRLMPDVADQVLASEKWFWGRVNKVVDPHKWKTSNILSTAEQAARDAVRNEGLRGHLDAPGHENLWDDFNKSQNFRDQISEFDTTHDSAKSSNWRDYDIDEFTHEIGDLFPDQLQALRSDMIAEGAPDEYIRAIDEELAKDGVKPLDPGNATPNQPSLRDPNYQHPTPEEAVAHAKSQLNLIAGYGGVEKFLNTPGAREEWLRREVASEGVKYEDLPPQVREFLDMATGADIEDLRQMNDVEEGWYYDTPDGWSDWAAEQVHDVLKDSGVLYGDLPWTQPMNQALENLPENRAIDPNYVPDKDVSGLKWHEPGFMGRMAGHEPGFIMRGADRVDTGAVTASNLLASKTPTFERNSSGATFSAGAFRTDARVFLDHVAQRETHVIDKAYKQGLVRQMAAKGENADGEITELHFKTQDEVRNRLGPNWVLVHPEFPIAWFKAEKNVLKEALGIGKRLVDDGLMPGDPAFESALDTLASADAQAFIRTNWGAMKRPGVAVPKDFFEYQRAMATVNDPFKNKFGRLYQKYINLWRTYTLAYMPRWALNTAVGTFLQAMVHGTINPRDYMLAKKLDKEGLLPPGVKLGHEAIAEDIGPPRMGAIERVTGARVPTRKLVEGVQAIEDHFRRSMFVQSLRKEDRARLNDMGETVKSWYEKGMTDEQRIRQMLEDHNTVDAALHEVNRFAYNYSHLGPFERRYVRQFIPFWGWYKFITKLAWRLPFEYPGRTRVMSFLSNVGLDQQDALGPIPDWLKGIIPLNLVAGHLQYLSTIGINPFSQFANPLAPHGAVNGLLQLGQLSPVLQAVEQAYGLDPLTGDTVRISPQAGVARDILGRLVDVTTGEQRSPVSVDSIPRFFASLLRAFPQYRLGEKYIFEGGGSVYPESIPFIHHRPMGPAAPGSGTGLVAELEAATGLIPKVYDLDKYQSLTTKMRDYARTRNQSDLRRLSRKLNAPTP